MGRRSRKPRAATSRATTTGPGGAAKRQATAEAAGDAPAARAGRSAVSRRDAAPAPPWGRFPLVELCVLSAICLGIAGFVIGGASGRVLLTGAVLMGSVAGLEVALREHVGGYRSHTLLLAAFLGIAAMVALGFAGLDRAIVLPIAAAVFATAFVAWRELFKRRSGGFGMKVR